MRVLVLADLPGPLSSYHQHAYNTKLERFDKIRTCGKHNFGNNFFEMVYQHLEEIIIIYQRNWNSEFFERLQ